MTRHFKAASGYSIHKDYKTFGWHIFSKGSAYKSYNFSLLWGVSYFSYMVNAKTGSYDNIHQWKTTALVDSAKVNSCKVFLTVSNFGEKRNTEFLKNPKAQKTLADSLSVLLDLRKANGINIDFEGVSSKDKNEFNQFIVTLSDRLHKINPDYMVSVALYAVDYHKIFDIKTIDSSTDFYTLMGYDYYGGFSKHAGPVSPLKSSKLWGAHSVESSVDYYINEGIKPGKLIVGLPYYGDKWKTEDTPIPSKAENFLSHNMYSTTRELLDSKKYKISFDTISSTQYGIYEEKGVMKQLWFDDSLSLSYKYDWIKHKKLAGVGIWALGYDHGHTELWELMANKFGQKQ
jgi:spore germination protein YaaH